MILEVLPDGMFESNCYIIGDSDSGEGAVIDPGAPLQAIMEIVDRHSLKIKYIILTHGHIDHICTVDNLQQATGAEIAIHKEDAAALTDSQVNLSAFFGGEVIFCPPDIELSDGNILKAGGLEFEIIHTPGHTPGSICIRVGNKVFSGDTLFKMSVGRTDLPGGNPIVLINSIRNKLLILDDETRVYPGHEGYTSIGREKRGNIFLKSRR